MEPMTGSSHKPVCDTEVTDRIWLSFLLHRLASMLTWDLLFRGLCLERQDWGEGGGH